jgi:hypothetical protein
MLSCIALSLVFSRAGFLHSHSTDGEMHREEERRGEGRGAKYPNAKKTMVHGEPKVRALSLPRSTPTPHWTIDGATHPTLMHTHSFASANVRATAAYLSWTRASPRQQSTSARLERAITKTHATRSTSGGAYAKPAFVLVRIPKTSLAYASANVRATAAYLSWTRASPRRQSTSARLERAITKTHATRSTSGGACGIWRLATDRRQYRGPACPALLHQIHQHHLHHRHHLLLLQRLQRPQHLFRCSVRPARHRTLPRVHRLPSSWLLRQMWQHTNGPLPSSCSL